MSTWRDQNRPENIVPGTGLSTGDQQMQQFMGASSPTTQAPGQMSTYSSHFWEPVAEPELWQPAIGEPVGDTDDPSSDLGGTLINLNVLINCA